MSFFAHAVVPGSRVVVLQGRNFPSFGAGDQGRVIRVDKEALNCEVLGASWSQIAIG